MTLPPPPLPPMAPMPLTVHRVRRETPDTVTLHLVDPTGAKLPAAAPGQFNMLYAWGVGESAISLSGDAESPTEWVHTIRAVGGVTRNLVALRPGDTVGIRGPYGTGWPMALAHGNDLLLIAGGLGLAPLRPAVYHALRHREAFRHVALLVGARTPSDLLFQDELRVWAHENRIQVCVTVDRANAPNAPWDGELGVVPNLLRRVPFEPAQTWAFVCGPEIMMRFCERELSRLGVAPQRMYLSLERNMKCALGFCGHCQLGPAFLCKNGPVLRYDTLQPFFRTPEA